MYISPSPRTLLLISSIGVRVDSSTVQTLHTIYVPFGDCVTISDVEDNVRESFKIFL